MNLVLSQGSAQFADWSGGSHGWKVRVSRLSLAELGYSFIILAWGVFRLCSVVWSTWSFREKPDGPGMRRSTYWSRAGLSAHRYKFDALWDCHRDLTSVALDSSPAVQ